MQQTLFGNSKFGLKAPQERMEIEQSKPKAKNLPWVEKYRPDNLQEISFQEEVVNSLQGVLKNGNLPNTLFYGPPGTGKTSTILAMAKSLFGPDFYRTRILELNASDDRGIQVVREKVKRFAQLMCTKNTNRYHNNQSSYLCPNYKIIILDEADLMTSDAQSALRRIMEDTSSSTRFCIICNYVTKIIEPIMSRCISYRFQPISIKAQFEKLQHICQQEGIQSSAEALYKLIDVSEGDLRKSINTLQSASTLYDKNINLQQILEISGIVPDNFIQEIIHKINQNNVDVLIKEIDQVLYEGYSSYQIMSQFYDEMLKSSQVSDLKKARIFEKVALCDKQLTEGSKDELALYALFTSCMNIINSNDL